MAVNQSPMYQKAEERYRSAGSPAERVAALEEMLRLVPKHKASEKLQASLKQKLKAAREETQRPHAKGGGGQHDLFHVPRQGAGQVVLLGAANVGKSSIVGALTHAKVEIAEFPYSTHVAVPGMAHHEDVPIQLVDMPPLMTGHAPPGMSAAYRSADVVLVVVDLSAIELLDQYEQPLAYLREHRLRAVSTATVELEEDEEAALPKRVVVAANKCDTAQAAENLAGMRELCGEDLKTVAVSATTGEGLGGMMAELFALLNVIRVYAKKPGKPVDKEAPFILPVGATVHDMAHLVHKDLAEKLKGARIWGGTVHDGQQVHATHVLTDKNVVELHF
ncbi:MAG TPA: GTPase [Phycisphaerae bacterium]|nr:GTPase [Phycisphaerae bacterium]